LPDNLPVRGPFLVTHGLGVYVHCRGDVGMPQSSCCTFTSVWFARCKQVFECRKVCQFRILRSRSGRCPTLRTPANSGAARIAA